VCGIIGARPVSPGHYGGIAPGVDLYVARVFPPDGGANQGDIVLAIDALSRTHQVDLINMSLGAEQGSQIERDAIQDALERGTLCICAAGNSSGAVGYPAAFSETVAISALGLLGWAPEGTSSAGRLPEEPEKFGDEGLFLANFSCFGPEISATAPGVGYISTVPARHGLSAPYAAMDGTSMASPAACGALAALLSQDTDYQTMPRDQTRAEMARTILRRRCRDIGLEPDYQGRGVPDATS
jgi:subtilisin